MSNTRTKTKVTTIGYEEYINSRTGEIEKHKIMKEEENTDFNFHKIWIKDLVKLLKALGGGKVEVFCYLLDKKNSENIFIGSINDIAKKLKISENTVKASLKLMKELDYVRMVKHGVYQISPNLLVKGKSDRRQILLTAYNSIENVKSEQVA